MLTERACAQGLDGNIALLDKDNKLVSTVDVAALIGHLGSLHPHDALFLPNGDFVVGTEPCPSDPFPRANHCRGRRRYLEPGLR